VPAGINRGPSLFFYQKPEDKTREMTADDRSSDLEVEENPQGFFPSPDHGDVEKKRQPGHHINPAGFFLCLFKGEY
jgi:hypothetical protein